MRFRFVSWNLHYPRAALLAKQIAYLRDLAPDVVALQEVSPAGCDVLESRGHPWPHALTSRMLRAALDSETTSGQRYCALLATERFVPVGDPALLEEAAAPERSIMVELDSGEGPLTVASFHQVAGSDTKKWGPSAKAQTFRAMAAWLGRHEVRAVAGIHVNSPKLDRPDVAMNEYFWKRRPGDQAEHLLHGPSRASHGLRDVYRTYLGDHQSRFDEIRASNPDGPLAVSHVVRGNPRRFDYIYATHELQPTEVRHEESILERTSGSRLSDHAPVIADLEAKPGL